jgi:hypothetical protein
MTICQALKANQTNSPLKPIFCLRILTTNSENWQKKGNIVLNQGSPAPILLKQTHTPMRIMLLALLCLAGTSLFAQPQCDNDSTGLIPLVDLGTSFYEGHQGGLFPGGSNVIPFNHKKKGMNISKGLKPLDTLGNINYDEGKIIFLGLGASLASNAFNAYIDSVKIYDFEGMNNCLDVKGMFFGGKDLDQMIDFENNSYWESVNNKMESRGDTYEQVQVIWLLQQSFEDTSSDFNTYYSSVMDKFVTLMHVLKDTFPNLKQVYLSGVHYMGYMDPNHFRYDAFNEPHGYWGNIVIKELIARQIMGDPALKHIGPAPNSAWISWGPNFWADGITPRAYDGLAWSCEQFRDDDTGGGFHLEDSVNALGVEAQMLKTFFSFDAVTTIWHQDGPLWAACPEDTLRQSNVVPKTNSLLIYPNPSNGDIVIKNAIEMDGEIHIKIANEMGVIVWEDVQSVQHSNYINQQLDLPNGMYFIQIQNKNQHWTQSLLIQD